jgi:riboflavin kinase/FMN adenylyltransferase
VRLLDAGDPACDREWPAVVNVGTRPTFHDSSRILAEAHLIDFDGDLYGRRVEISFRFHLRSERRFDDVEALRQQIGADVAEGRRRLEVS